MSKRPLRLIFAGTPAFAAQHLTALIDSPHRLVGVYTQPDRRAGRGRQHQASPVKQMAENAGLPVYQPTTLKDAAAQKTLTDLHADLMIVVAYGLILPQAALDAPAQGCLNVHASLLPRWRGAAPIQRAIEAGDASSGVTIMRMDAGLDTGAMLATAACPIGATTNTAELQDAMAQIGAPLLLSVLDDIEAALHNALAQDDAKASYANKISKAEAEIDWTQAASTLDRKIRAFNPAPVCFTYMGDRRVRVWQAKPLSGGDSHVAAGTIIRAHPEGIVVRCGEGELALKALQLEGGKVVSARQLLGTPQSPFTPGGRFAPRVT
ncbi:MAG: methionyl-tRNA formyltransferase [Halioglobus sp.]|nr:methionyl-tRNA formyltransferase [Halioglobus sp.]